MENGWIKIHRKILDNPVLYRDADFLAIWVHILLNAAYETHDTWFEGKRFTLHPGQFITGRKKIAKTLHVSESKVERVLTCLENEQQIEQLATPRGRLISVKNWKKYQISEQQNGQQVNNKRTTSGQQVNTTKERKEDKEGKEDSYVEIIDEWNKLPEPIAKIQRITKGSTRDKKLRKRIADNGTENVKKAIANIKRSNFLQGGGSKGWTITFDWFISPDNFVKVLEGNYNDKKTETNKEEYLDDVEKFLKGMLNG